MSAWHRRYRVNERVETSADCRLGHAELTSGRLIAVFSLAVLSAIGQCISAGVISLSASVAIVAIAVFSPLRTCLLEMFVCLPFFNTMTSTVGSTSLYYLLLGVFIVKAFTTGVLDKIRIRIVTLAVVILLTLQNLQEPYLYLRWLLVAAPFVLLVDSKTLGNELYLIIILYSISSIVSTVFGYYLQEHGLLTLTESYVYSQGSNISRFGGLVGDPVMFSETLVFLVACNLALLLTGRAGKLSVLCVIGLSIPCALTYSRTSIAVLAVLLGFSLLYVLTHHMLDRRKILTGIVALCLIAAFILVVVVYVSTNPDSDLVSGFTARLDSGDLLTGRDELWQSYMSWFGSQDIVGWLLGVGFSDYNQHVFPYEGLLLNRCHNIYLETLVLFGILGSTLFLIVILGCIAKGIKRRLPTPNFLPVAVLLVFGIVLHGHTESFYYFLWIVALGFVSQHRTTESNGTD